ncbi:MAG: hypothetical protein LBR06_08580 [Bacteroidales bacterium]|jgi:hypothetical protein|nr:hypothetical protein [Bacteroidales bacterium]
MILRTVARVISTVFHPLLIPTWGFAMLLWSGIYSASLHSGMRWEIMRTVFLTTCVFPAALMRIIELFPESVAKLGTNMERVVPLLATALFYIIGANCIGNMPVHRVFRILLSSASFTVIILCLVSFSWKISVHAGGIGGMLGIVLALALHSVLNLWAPVSCIILLCGLIGTSRLLLEKHTVAQVFAGYLAGIVPQFIYYMIF